MVTEHRPGRRTFLRSVGWEVREEETVDSRDEWYVCKRDVLLLYPGKPQMYSL